MELTAAEQKEVLAAKVLFQLAGKKAEAEKTMALPGITVEQKAAWTNHLLSLDLVPLQADFPFAPRIPASPVV